MQKSLNKLLLSPYFGEVFLIFLLFLLAGLEKEVESTFHMFTSVGICFCHKGEPHNVTLFAL